ncbi:holothin acyltransferase-like [Argopecten irradians]|uniref:holothin acyltransferase-like n=1 Tax=Argopecten irradians TaxID=31199 RepID=UPI00371423D8
MLKCLFSQCVRTSVKAASCGPKWLSTDTREETKMNYEVRPMRRSDIPPLYELLRANQWNMEKSYLECVFNTDPTGLVVVAKDDGEIIGHNGILVHSPDFASSGMNIVKEEYRSLGVGREMFSKVMDIMADRNVGGTSLSNRISFYAQFGWTIKSYTFHYNQGPVNPDFVRNCPDADCEIEPSENVNFDDVIAYDAEIHTIPRPVYISNWAQNEAAKTYVAFRGGRVCGYGVLKTGDTGHKLYPLYADDNTVAMALFSKLVSHIPRGSDLIFTQPIENEEANRIVAGNNLTTYLSMTRLYNKRNVPVDIKRVYSVSTTEYGIV